MPVSDLPLEILDGIIDELQHDEKSLLQASLACRAFYPRTRVHLFSVFSVASPLIKSCKSNCDRLRELITLSPKLALHFKSLYIIFLKSSTPQDYRALTVVESLIKVTHLYLDWGNWCHMPDSVVSSLQSHSYRVLHIHPFFHFTSIGEICSLVKNSPNLKQVDISIPPHYRITEECNLDHSLYSTPAPVAVSVHEFPDASAGTVMKSVFFICPVPIFPQ
ncbi:hypothetical protein EDD85DRAFT_261459 [Armillaria nabsnona]|nr:hypothetical protein EDD85DRAFT_261459 [Armillaria nabsnona]